MNIAFSVIVLFIFSFVNPASAVSSAASAVDATATGQSTHTESSRTRYRLATLPSTNKKRIDSMCVKFLSVIPKATLIPRSEERAVYRLVTRNYENMESARRYRAELSRHCESPFVMKEDNFYFVIAGSQLTEAAALEEQKRLAARNIRTTIRRLNLPLKEWQMKSTESYSIRDAVHLAQALSKKGVVSILEPVQPSPAAGRSEQNAPI